METERRGKGTWNTLMAAVPHESCCLHHRLHTADRYLEGDDDDDNFYYYFVVV